jgi:hypothetical protein
MTWLYRLSAANKPLTARDIDDDISLTIGVYYIESNFVRHIGSTIHRLDGTHRNSMKF